MYSHEHDAKLVIFLSVCNLISLFLLHPPYLLTYIKSRTTQRWKTLAGLSLNGGRSAPKM